MISPIRRSAPTLTTSYIFGLARPLATTSGPATFTIVPACSLSGIQCSFSASDSALPGAASLPRHHVRSHRPLDQPADDVVARSSAAGHGRYDCHYRRALERHRLDLLPQDLVDGLGHEYHRVSLELHAAPGCGRVRRLEDLERLHSQRPETHCRALTADHRDLHCCLGLS